MHVIENHNSILSSLSTYLFFIIILLCEITKHIIFQNCVCQYKLRWVYRVL